MLSSDRYWFGLVAPAKTPRELIVKLNQAIVKGLSNAEIRERLLGQGLEPIGNSPALPFASR